MPTGGIALNNTLFDKDPSVFCFAEGARIETAAGPKAVEALSVGEMLVTASGEQRPVTWIGELTSRPAHHPRPWDVNPVRIGAHAFGPNVPARDVRLSPGHAVFVDGVLVPACRLVNGATVVQEAVDSVRYFHVELESHDVILAEGLPCESYLDDGNRQSFNTAGGVVDLFGRLDPQSWDDACAPMVAAGPQLAAIRQRLLAQAEALGWRRSEDADLRIEADGVEFTPVETDGLRYRFEVPAAETVVLKSASGVLAHTLPGLDDQRRLGVALAELRIDGVAVDLADEVFGEGFHPIERNGASGWRWTDGAASLRIVGPAVLEVTLAMAAPSWRAPAGLAQAA